MPAELTGVRPAANGRASAPEVVDTAALVWEVRHVTRDQESRLTEYAEVLGGA
ncbi:hypothetical protein [Streptomyces sp. NBC_01294]|uniref:hypothetical protein n=1 Tax=Streptomyces sp. NBC_01294 TaxID=2903815 RepID=UPI002DD8D489|nr:hypothetical protein [Streptomyces sp. NBC_01294]WRZ55278.1 hypothetical protein OG534_01535 [Streptomyces sp. NBC_01294]WRZ61418.1 hypothetical protein OG534_35965 [Streptomyces sp. NBC_01294]